MKQSTRRMVVAQKRIQQNKDVLRRPITIHKQQAWFMYWWHYAPDIESYLWHYSKLAWQVKLTGPLPGNKRLVQGLPVDIVWDSGEWLVSETFYRIHATGPTISKAVASFRRILPQYLDGLTKREKDLGPQTQEQLAYLREMIEDIQA